MEEGAEQDVEGAGRVSRQVIGLQPGQEIRILVVDDKEPNRVLLCRMLEGVGFCVREAVDGEEAMGVFGEWDPALILMDLVMPGMDGYEAMRRMRLTDRGQEVVIIAVSASAFEEDREKVLSAGADGFVRKPFKEDELFEEIREHLGVEYVYSEEELPAPGVPETPEVPAPTRASLSGVPVELVDQMREATINADLHRLNELIDQVAEYDGRLAEGLRDLANGYAYEALSDLFQPEEEG